MRTFQYSDAKSHKFWNIDLSGTSFTVTYGRVGSSGQTQTKTFASAEKAQAEADKLVREKVKKGYIETTPVVPTREAVGFEKALVANPDDMAGWSAYTDYLMEQGNPRGEFMRVQLALEDESRTAAERKKLRTVEKAILDNSEREWLGELAPYLLDYVPTDDFDSAPKPEYRWRNGFLWSLTVGRLTMSIAQVLASAPGARFLSELRIYDTDLGFFGANRTIQPPPRRPTPVGIPEHSELFELIGGSCLQSLRRFQMGGEVPPVDGWCDCNTYARGLEHFIASIPRIEELGLYCKSYNIEGLFALPNLNHLRVLRVYHYGHRANRRGGPGYEYPLEVLAQNSALGSLSHLYFHPHHEESYLEPRPSFLPLNQVSALLRSKHLKGLTHLQIRLSNMGDKGCEEIVASGILKRLKWLDLQHGCITDEGARLFAACTDARNLERLDLSRNAVSSAGLNTLRRAGVNAVANNPLTEQELADQTYLREGDFE